MNRWGDSMYLRNIGRFYLVVKADHAVDDATCTR